jgi:hypothetical protein
MSTPQTAPTPEPQVAADTRDPNQYRLHGHGVEVTYYPTGAGPLTVDGALILTYQDAQRSLEFRGQQAQVVAVADLGTCVTVTIQMRPDADRTTATLLIPTVVLPAGQPSTVHTELITTVHDSTFSGLGDPQRDHYTVTRLTGEASQVILPQ